MTNIQIAQFKYDSQIPKHNDGVVTCTGCRHEMEDRYQQTAICKDCEITELKERVDSLESTIKDALLANRHNMKWSLVNQVLKGGLK